MTQTRTFPRGGVRPAQTAAIPRSEPVTNATVPARAVVPLRQHAGEAAQRVVQVGDGVVEGMVVGKAFGPHSAHVHSSIPGRVAEIIRAEDHSGEACEAVVIDLGGEFARSGRSTTVRPWEASSRFELLALVQAAGVVDRGGSREPAHLALAVPPGREAGRLVVNGVESDPALSCTSALLREKPREIVEGTRIAMKILGLSAGALIAMSEADAGLVPAFERAIDSAGAQIGIRVVSARYPQEHSQLLLAALDGRAAARGGGSRARGTSGEVILSAATLFAVYEAVVLAKPLTEGIVTVTGSPLAVPRNLKVRFGTPVADLVDDCGGLREEPGAVVLGGLMSGRVAASLRVPVTKTTTGVLLLSRKQVCAAAGARPCIGCGRCLEACPWGLEPARLYKLLDRGMADEARVEGLEDCSVCGCCAFVCPSRIALAQGLDLGRRGRPLDGI